MYISSYKTIISYDDVSVVYHSLPCTGIEPATNRLKV